MADLVSARVITREIGFQRRWPTRGRPLQKCADIMGGFAPGDGLFLRYPAHPGAVRPSVGGEVAEEWADFGGDGVEDYFALFGSSF